MTATATIEFDRIAEQVDLVAMAQADGVDVRHGKALCPFHDNQVTPALSFFVVGGRWRFRCHACDAKGDAITWRSLIDQTTIGDAARKLGGNDAPEKAANRPATRSPGGGVDGIHLPTRERVREAYRPPDGWIDPGWQETADAIIDEAARTLWAAEGRAALAWLRARGLADHTIHLFRLGFNPARRWATPAGFNVERGVLLPWVHPDAWYVDAAEPDGPRWVGCNVRRVADQDDADDFGEQPGDSDKCRALAGSSRGFGYPFGADFTPGRPILICEGEWDALVAWQELGWICNVASFGGNNQTPRPESLEALAACPLWLLASHPGQSGRVFAEKWEKRGEGKARRLTLPGCDLNDLHRQGPGMVRAWLREEYDLLDLPWPAREPMGS